MSDPAEDKLRKQALDEIALDIEHLQHIVAEATVIADKRGYTCTGWDALYVLFAEKFSWTPEKVRSLRIEELGWMLDTFFQG